MFGNFYTFIFSKISPFLNTLISGVDISIIVEETVETNEETSQEVTE